MESAKIKIAAVENFTPPQKKSCKGLDPKEKVLQRQCTPKKSHPPVTNCFLMVCLQKELTTLTFDKAGVHFPLRHHHIMISASQAIPSPFYEARFGTEIFIEIYYSTLSSRVSSYMLKRYITFYFIDLTIIVYCYYGYLPILQHI